MNVLINMLDLLLVFNIPSLPDGVMEMFDFAMSAVYTGMGILNNYVDIAYIFSLFGVIVVIEGAHVTYKFVMWVLRKIPMAGIS